MKNMYNNKRYAFHNFIRASLLVALLTSGACEEFIKIDPPRTTLVKSTVFDNEATANAAMTNIYYNMRSQGFASGNVPSISFWGTYSSDEQINIYTPYEPFSENELTPDNGEILSLWSELYKTIYDANAIIEGVIRSSNLSDALKMQLEGEARFIRAFCHFYLVNLFGDVPVVTTTNHKLNASLPRHPVGDVYKAIVADLSEAKKLLPEDYMFAGNERVRVNRYAAIALLGRAYLYMQDWSNAEEMATEVISNADLYSLTPDLNDVFKTNGTEAILQLWSQYRPYDWFTFSVFFGTPIYGSLRPEFANSFETGDLRRTTWIGLTASGYYETRKYTINEPPSEYSTLLRLAEQYLIRAEARAHQNNITGAQQDINAIRNRAGLPGTSASDKPSLLLAIEQERKAELFTEWGHRWLDLKRTNRADEVLSPIKGNSWQSTDILYPIPEAQIQNDPAMVGAQNPGY